MGKRNRRKETQKHELVISILGLIAAILTLLASILQIIIIVMD